MPVTSDKAYSTAVLMIQLIRPQHKMETEHKS